MTIPGPDETRSYFKIKKKINKGKNKEGVLKHSVAFWLDAQSVCSFNMGRETPPAVVY